MPKGYHHLIRDQRSQIYALKSKGFTQKDIASHLKIAPSSISRELRRNQGKKGYRFQQADNLATERRHQASSRPRCMTPEVVQAIEEKLLEKWSPEQISGRLKLELKVQVSHETIYQHVWNNKRNGGTLYKHLRHAGKRYHRRSSGKAGRGCIPNRVDIQERPAIVEKKVRLGDWEGDTIIGAQHRGAVLTLVDRVSKKVLLAKLEQKTAKQVIRATEQCFSRSANSLLHTLTYDNGKEFSGHELISSMLGVSCYFATPYHSWERGLNEHTNGLIRQYLPKSTDLSKVSAKELQVIENSLNNRPRKALYFLTPNEVELRLKKPMSLVLRC